MTPDPNLPNELDLGKLHQILTLAHDQVVTALWLSSGMVCAFGTIAGIALGWRRAALVGGFLYSLTLCGVRNGHAQILGPLGCAMAFTGFFWPRRKRPD
jgi:hypothetical protein